MGILAWIHDRIGGAGAAKDVRARDALERVVQLANPRLRYARRYRQRLMPAFRTALEYAGSLVADAPPARDATAAAWQSDPYIRAFFATAADVPRAFSRSPELRSWFETHPAAQEIYAVLGMLLEERRILGTTLEGGVIRRDVPQVTLSFTDHRARILGGSEADLREEIERRIVDQLALAALAIAVKAQSRRDLLEQERALLRVRLRLLEGKGAGMTAISGKSDANVSQLAHVQSDLAVNEGNLKTLAAGSHGLDYQLDCLCEVLGKPADHFFVSMKRVRIDRMNVVLAEGDPQPGETLDLQTARVPIPDAPPELRTFSFVRFPRSALLPRTELFSDAARSLH